MKLIVKIIYDHTEAVAYWLCENEGTTPSRAEAYRYTVDELQHHMNKDELDNSKRPKHCRYTTVLVPVED